MQELSQGSSLFFKDQNVSFILVQTSQIKYDYNIIISQPCTYFCRSFPNFCSFPLGSNFSITYQTSGKKQRNKVKVTLKYPYPNLNLTQNIIFLVFVCIFYLNLGLPLIQVIELLLFFLFLPFSLAKTMWLSIICYQHDK